MFNNLPLTIGLRYSRAKRRNGFVSFIGWVSIIGIAVGVWALITTLSVMNGFGNELRGRILDVASHITVEDRNDWLGDWRTTLAVVSDFTQQDLIAPYVDGQGLVTFGGTARGVVIRGIDPELESKVSNLDDLTTFLHPEYESLLDCYRIHTYLN